MTSDDDDQQQVAQYANPKRQTRPPRVSLDIPDGSFAPSLSPTKDAPETEAESGTSPSSASAKRLAQTPIADMFKSPLTAAVATTAPSTVTATAVSSKTMPPRLGLQLGNSQDVDEMGWSRGVLDAAASASLGHLLSSEFLRDKEFSWLPDGGEGEESQHDWYTRESPRSGPLCQAWKLIRITHERLFLEDCHSAKRT
ncbi:hypothetical protein AG1IA_01813 [Rhizoctonia solani AG-1 IA]|uniref:Uncharacterized protein n=1 Tax=Thanatephorus cucumeris (strain AG1-IA) TaxID=983506 RepID=L8X1G1_THACA|nr:hypothetical protein AG1IA_01813 [Rhizoctonia solani AG-1 IA]